MKKKILKIIIPIIIVILVLDSATRLLMPKYATDIVEGNLIKEYYQESNKDFDVVFFGDCEVYENFSPVTLWEEYGINSYIRGSAEQYIWQSYYLLEETLAYHKPKVAVFNIQSLQFNESQSEPYNRMTLDGMKWSPSKVNSILASMKDNEKFIDYVFPLLRFHSRWSELTTEDFEYWYKAHTVSHNGYYMRVDAKPAGNLPSPKKLGDYSFGDKAWSYLEKMRELCEKEGIKLVLIKAPSLWPYWYEEWDTQVKDYAIKHKLTYINFLEVKDKVGLDYDKDTYDAGLHLNVWGAEKMSLYFGRILRDKFACPDRRLDKDLREIWSKKVEAYYEEIEEQKIKYGIKD
ncbi:MAG: SGNH/GDSL hydrolase family protein [Lachnospiraceae bacterium]|nr:SGNH/GDSL hydrolase family protein [Lachnospiraceae bacterium]